MFLALSWCHGPPPRWTVPYDAPQLKPNGFAVLRNRLTDVTVDPTVAVVSV